MTFCFHGHKKHILKIKRIFWVEVSSLIVSWQGHSTMDSATCMASKGPPKLDSFGLTASWSSHDTTNMHWPILSTWLNWMFFEVPHPERRCLRFSCSSINKDSAASMSPSNEKGSWYVLWVCHKMNDQKIDVCLLIYLQEQDGCILKKNIFHHISADTLFPSTNIAPMKSINQKTKKNIVSL